MSPLLAMKALNDVPASIENRLAGIKRQVESIQSQWQSLGRIGGQRSDHAAELIAKLSPELESLEEFLTIVRQQIAAMKSDPFAD